MGVPVRARFSAVPAVEEWHWFLSSAVSVAPDVSDVSREAKWTLELLEWGMEWMSELR